MSKTGLEDIKVDDMSIELDDMFEATTSVSDMVSDYKLVIIGSRRCVINKKTLNIIEVTATEAKIKFGKDGYEQAPFYEGYSNEADNINYKLFNGKFINSNNPLPYKPKEGKWPTIEKMLRHCCGTDYELILQYYSNMILYPRQRLPLVLLLSQENNTGKTTMAEWTARMMGENAVKIRGLDISSQFSGYHANKQFGYVDEALEGAHKYQDISVLKDMVTAEVVSSEIKNGAKINSINNLKIMMCSNDVYNAIAMEGSDTRVWPLKVPVMKNGIEEDKDTFINKLNKEIPAFMNFIINEFELPPSRGRLYFDRKEIDNDLKIEIKEINKPEIVVVLDDILSQLFDSNPTWDVIQCTSHQIKLVTKAKTSLNRIYSIFIAEGVEYENDNTKWYERRLLKALPPFTFGKSRGRYFTFPRPLNL